MSLKKNVLSVRSRLEAVAADVHITAGLYSVFIVPPPVARVIDNEIELAVVLTFTVGHEDADRLLSKLTSVYRSVV